MATQKKKRIMREFALDEISTVTVPAQKGARMLIMKRADDPAVKNGVKHLPLDGEKLDISKLSAEDIAQLVLKGRLRMTTPANGHSHLIDVDEFAQARGGGQTNGVGEGDVYHSHPFIVTKGGDITIGYSMGHSHEVMSIEAVKAAASPARVESTTEKGTDMDEKEVKKLRALAEMDDAQKAYFGKLGAGEQEAFIGLTAGERASTVATAVQKAAGDNPVVYTSRNGSEYRKGDDPRLVQMAKDRDADMAAAEVAKAAALEAEATQLAKSWDFMGKPMEEKIKDAKAILGASPEVKKAALDAIEAQRKAFAPLFVSHGARDGSVTTKTAEAEATEELNKLAEERMAKSNETYAVAYDKVLQSPQGARLYSKANPRLGGSMH